MSFGRQFVISVLVMWLLLAVGCVKKKPQLPPQAKAPVATVPVPLPAEISEETPPPPPPAAKREPSPQEVTKPKPASHHRRKPAQPPAVQSNTTGANGANSTMASAKPPSNPETPPDMAIAADVSSAQLSQQKQTTTQLLEAAEKTLNGLNRSLSHDEEEIVAQVRSYILQSRKATTDGDFERAYNLATKAHLLSDALVKK